MSAIALEAYPDPGRIESAALAALVHLVLFAILFFGVQWQSNRPEQVTVDLWDLPPVVETPPPLPAAEAPPVKPEEPAPAPKAEPKAEPKPDIALREKLEKKKIEEQKALEQKALEDKARQDDLKRRAAEREKSLAEERDKLRKEAESLQAQREAAGEQARLEAQRSTAKMRAVNEYTGRIRAKIRANIVVPDGIKGKPEAVFDVLQLPSGEILSAKLRKPSGHAAYDAAVERAILKSSPLPKPADPGLFQRALELHFTPLENN
jgi:colicin import membrane protein